MSEQETHSEYFEIDGNIVGWVANHSSIMLKAITNHGDPVEINAEEARELIKALERCIAAAE